MAKALMAVSGAVVALVGLALLIGATQDAAKDDVREILLRMERRQIADMHPRLFKLHSYWHGFCDSDDFCRLVETRYVTPEEKRSSRAAFLDKVESLRGREFRQRFDAYTTPPKDSAEK